MAEQSSSCASGRWSRLGERCTCGQSALHTHVPHRAIPSPHARNLVPGLSVLASWWRRWAQDGRGAWCSADPDARACNWLTPVGPPPPPSARRP